MAITQDPDLPNPNSYIPDVAGGSVPPPGYSPPATPNPVAPPVNTSQPNPATVNATPYTSSAFYKPATPVAGLDPNTVFNDKNEPLSYEQYIAQGGAKDFSNVQKVSALQQGLAKAQASGAPPQDAGAGRSGVATNMPPSAPDNSMVTNTLANDPGYQKLIADAKNISNVAAQQTTLLDTYKQMEADAGIPAIDTQLLNSQKIINGTEDDIRNEVTAAGGFATDSQVLGLATARNKTLIQNYNNLLATKQNAEDHINSMINLVGQDKQFALNTANQQLQIDQQLNDYAQKFQSNAQEGYRNILSAVGYSGLVNSLLNSDPSGQSLSLAEQTLGMAPGQLKGIATQEKSAQNLQIIQATGATSPFVVTPQGEVWNTSTGYAYESPEDFQAKTGMTLEQANAKKAIQPPPPNMDMLIKQAQLVKAQTDAKYAGAIDQANINQSNASAASSAASAANSRADAAFKAANNGLTPAEVNAQNKAISDAQQNIQNDASALIGKLNAKTNPISWQDAYAELKTKYFPADNSQEAANTIDTLLQANNFRR